MNRLILVLILCAQPLLAQNKNPLSKIIANLSNFHKVTFSYDPMEIDSFLKVNTPPLQNLEKALILLRNETNLVFQKIDNVNYVIFKNNAPKGILCGKILDSRKTPILGVKIINGLQSTYTNKEGFFYLKEEGKSQSIFINAFGFESETISTSLLKTGCKTFTLKQQTINLKDVIISNYITEGISKNENGSIQIDITKTGILPGVIEPDALQSLQFIPGVQSPDETVSGLHIRGSTPDQNLILHDGVKAYQDAHFFGLLSVFNPYTINNVELSRSATKAKYGGHAGGVISIGIDNEIPKKLNAGIGATFTHADSYIKAPLIKNKLAIFASSRASITDQSNNITFKKYSKVAFQNTSVLNDAANTNRITDNENSFAYQDFYAKLIYKPIEQLKISFGFLANNNKLKFEGLDNIIQTNFRDDLSIDTYSVNQSTTYKSSTFGTHSLQLSKTSYDKDYNGLNKFNPRIRTPTLLEITFSKENYIQETSLKYIGKKEINKNTLIEYGYQKSKSNVGYKVSNYGIDFTTNNEIFDGNETSQSFFTDIEWKWKKIKANIGGRRQYFNRLNTAFWEPRILVNYKLRKKLWLRFSYEKKHQSISQITDLRNDGLGNLFDRLWVVSTKNEVPILTNNQITLGIDYQKNGWTIDIEAYSKKLDGIGILLNENIFNPENVTGINRVKGIDILLKKQWNKYQTWLSYSYSKNEFQFKNINDNKPFSGSFDIPHSLVWTHTYAYKKFDFSLGYRYHSGIPYTQKNLDLSNPNGNFIGFEKFNDKRLPDYFRLDFTGSYNFKLNWSEKINATLGFTLQNLTNRRSLLSRDFRVIEVSNTQDRNTINRPELQRIDRISLGLVPNFIFRLNL